MLSAPLQKIPTASQRFHVLPIVLLLSSYFGLRVLFKYWEASKQAFIYPTGYLVNCFYGQGSYTGNQWQLAIGNTPFTLSSQCSGTTFFSLLVAFIIFKAAQQPRWWAYLLLAYPITLIANTTRVTSLMFTHKTLAHINAIQYDEIAHIIVGTVTFLSFFLMCILIFEYCTQRPVKGFSK